jgi:hypothetical protein
MPAKAIIALVALILISTSAQAGLKSFLEANEHGWDFLNYGEGIYDSVNIKRDSITKTQNGFRIWILMNLHPYYAPNKKRPFQSIALMEEFNCKEKMHRSLTKVMYSEKWAMGNVVPNSESVKPARWEYVVPGTDYAKAMDAACPEGKPNKKEDSIN